MKLVVGLGNPGPKYETTRHNVGFLAADRLIDRWRAEGPTTKNQSEVWQATVSGEKVLIVKPQTFMNLSGRAIAPLFTFHKCEPTDLIVIYDELDLKPMQLRVKTGGGAAGHNGIRSVDQSLGTAQNGYHRIRIGIGKSPNPQMAGADWVLAQFSDAELGELDPLLDRVGEAAELLIAGKAGDAMTRYNRDPA